MKFEIYKGYLDELTKKINRIQKKCKALGLDFTYTIGDEFVKMIKPCPSEAFEDTRIQAQPFTFVEVEVEGTARIEGWEFIATLEHKGNGNVIRKAVHEVELPERFRTCSPWCEHCNKIRSRKDTYVVRNTESGEFKQVAKNCLMEYTNGLSAEMVAMAISWRSLFEDAQSNSYGGFGFGDSDYVKVSNLLGITVEVIKHFGYTPKYDQNGDWNRRNTGSVACDFYNYFYSVNCSRWTREDVEKAFDRIGGKDNFQYDSEENLATVNEALSWISSVEATTDYLNNLKVISENEFCSRRDMGLLISLIPTWRRETEKVAKIAKIRAESTSEYVGEIGKRQDFTNLTLKKVVKFEVDGFSYYSRTEMMYVYTFEDEAGNAIVYKSTSFFGTEIKVYRDREDYYHTEYRRLEEGDVVSFKGTVKAHKEYKGVKQTVVQRCKLSKVLDKDGKEIEDTKYVKTARGTFNIEDIAL